MYVLIQLLGPYSFNAIATLTSRHYCGKMIPYFSPTHSEYGTFAFNLKNFNLLQLEDFNPATCAFSFSKGKLIFIYVATERCGSYNRHKYTFICGLFHSEYCCSKTFCLCISYRVKPSWTNWTARNNLFKLSLAFLWRTRNFVLHV